MARQKYKQYQSDSRAYGQAWIDEEPTKDIRLDYTKNMTHFVKRMSKFRSEFQYMSGEQPSQIGHPDKGGQ